jgi:outer membrane protein TolC
VTASLNLKLDLSAKMVFDVTQTAIEYNTGKITLEKAKKEIKRDIKKNYYNLIILNENIKFLEKSLESAKKRYELTEKQFKNNIISELDKLNSEYNYKDITTEYIDKINNYENALLSFKKLLGIKSEFRIKLTEEIQISNEKKFLKNKDLNQYLENNLDIKLLKANINQKTNDRNSAIAQLTPIFSIEYLIDPKFSRTDPFGEDNNWFYYEDDWQQDKGALTFTISLSLSSLIPFSKEQMKIVNANYNIQRYKLLLENTRNEKELEINSIVSEINKNENNIESMELNLEIAKKIFQLSELSFQNGLIDILKLIDSEKNLIEANLKLLNAKNSYLANIFDLEYLLNTKI